MAWVLARHGFDGISGAHVINHHIEMTVHTITETPSTPTSPSHSAHTAQLGRLKKISPTMRQHSPKQMYTNFSCCYVTTNPKHSHISSSSPSLLQQKVVRSGQPVQRGSRTSSIFSLIQTPSRDDNNVPPRVDSTSS